MRKLILLFLLLACAAGLWAGSPTTVNSYITTGTYYSPRGCHGSNYPYACDQSELVDWSTLGAEHSNYYDNETGTNGYWMGYSTLTFDVRPQVPAGATLASASLHFNVTDYRSDSGCSLKVQTGWLGSTVSTITGTGVYNLTLSPSDINLSGTTTFSFGAQSYDDGCHPTYGQINSVTIDGKPSANKPYLILQYQPAPSVTGASGLPASYARNVEYTLTTTFNDPAGAGDFNWLNVVYSDAGTNYYNSCYIQYRPYDNGLFFHKDDAYYYWYGVVGSGGTYSNSSCSVNMATSSVSTAGDSKTLNLKITFLGGSKPTIRTYASIDYGALRGGANLSTGWGGPYGPTATLMPPVTISTLGLPSGLAGTAYSQSLAATGGTPPYTWSLASGSLPSGLTLSAAGTISGTPTVAGTYPFTVRVTDSTAPTPLTATQNLSITLGAALSITTTTLPTGVAGSAYSQTLAASGGTPGYSWSLGARPRNRLREG